MELNVIFVRLSIFIDYRIKLAELSSINHLCCSDMHNFVCIFSQTTDPLKKEKKMHQQTNKKIYKSFMKF